MGIEQIFMFKNCMQLFDVPHKLHDKLKLENRLLNSYISDSDLDNTHMCIINIPESDSTITE